MSETRIWVIPLADSVVEVNGKVIRRRLANGRWLRSIDDPLYYTLRLGIVDTACMQSEARHWRKMVRFAADLSDRSQDS